MTAGSIAPRHLSDSPVRLARAARARAIAVGLGLLAAAACAPGPTHGPGSGGGPAVASAGFERDPARGVLSLAPVVEPAIAAVVNVAAEHPAPTEQNPLLQDEIFRRFFGLPDDLPTGPSLSAGSGVVIDAGQGMILTALHVIDGARSIEVTLQDGRVRTAAIVGIDEATDLALLRIAAGGLREIAFADSDALRVGDLAIAIGNPFGLGHTVTSGIVSALGRPGLQGYQEFIQTDASINPGNSGGALIDSRGRLIGINSAILSRTGASVGIGFAVPSNLARDVVGQLSRFGEVRRARIGVVVQDLTPDLAEAAGLERPVGALIAEVETGSPAARAGLRGGDVILAVDGEAVRGPRSLQVRIGLVEEGRPVTLTVARDGDRLTLPVTPERGP
ncbi:MAG: trypsin-like peptidase domain-containing protein [Azospirillaceae bacterium]